MRLREEWVRHTRDGQPVDAFLAAPAMVSEPLPAVLVIQEIWGPDDHIQDVARRFATAGYVALAPDLYSRGGRPEALRPERIDEMKAFMDTVPTEAWHSQEALQQSLAREPQDKAARIQETLGRLFGPRDTEGMVADLKAWLDFLGDYPATRGMPVGTTGYCMGGALSFLLATRDTRPRVALVYYGAAPEPDAMSRIACPVYGFYGGRDPRITDAVPGVAEAMRARGKTYEYVVYPDAPHAFFNDTRKSYHVGAARDAWARTLGYFNRYLAP
jgi:carboxymethylenebutenolidase